MKEKEKLFDLLFDIASKRRTAKQYNPNKNIDRETMKKIYQFSKTAPHTMGLELVRIVSFDRKSKYRSKVNEYLEGFNFERGSQASDIGLIITKKNSFLDEKNESLKERAIRNSKFAIESKGEEFKPGMEDDFFKMVVSGYFANKNGGSKEEWLARQGYIHLSYILLAAKTLGIDTTTMEGFKSELTDYLVSENIINKDEKVTLVVVFGIVDETVKNPFIGDEQLRISDDEYIDFK